MAKYTKRRDKRGYEWKSAYREKEALMLERGYPEAYTSLPLALTANLITTVFYLFLRTDKLEFTLCSQH